jgi:pimeloyl-ACP methyl ester carboxylesterase
MIGKTTRRKVLTAATAALGTAALADSTRPASAQTMPRTFVLVHGSWHGGWCWRRVADRLEKQGHKVFAPTLTGLGERAHLISAQVDINTHVTDIVSVIKFESLDNIVLVGHSYAGLIITGVAEQIGSAISSIVYLDAFLPDDGDTLVGLSPEKVRAATFAARDKGEISRPFPPASAFGVNEKDQAWVNSKLTPQPLGTSFMPIKMTGAREKIAKKTFIRLTGYQSPFFDKALAQCRANKTWRTFEIATGHDIMVNMPDELTNLILEAA